MAQRCSFVEKYCVTNMIVLLILLCRYVNTSINLIGPTATKDLASCINNLIERNFEKPGLLIFGSTDNNPPIANIRADILKEIHESMKFSVISVSPKDKEKVCNSNTCNDCRVLHRDQAKPILEADYFLIIINNFMDFIYLLSRLTRSRSWNPYAKFLIFLINFTYNEAENIENVENILSCLFRYNAVNVIVAIHEPGRTQNTLLYSWKPYDPPRYCGYLNETARNRLILEDICERGIVKKQKNLFYNKLPKNMMHCKLYILALEKQPFFSKYDEDPNIEKVLVETMLGTFNFSMHYKVLDEFRGERNESGSWNGALGHLVANQGQILLGDIFPDFDVHEDFECSSFYLADFYAWVVPRADPTPPSVALTIIFKFSVWCSIGAGFVLCILSWKILGHMSNDSSYHKSLIHSFLNTCLVSLGFSAYVRPVKQSLRIFFVFLNLYCTILLTAYQTKLIEVLQNPAYFGDQIDTIEELVQSGIKFGGTEELHDLFANSSDTFYEIINEKWVVVDDVSSALIDVGVHRNFSVLCSRLELMYLSATMTELSDEFGRLRYYTFNLDTFSAPAELIALRGFPFMKKFSQTLVVLKELGINEWVRRRFAWFSLRRRTKLLLSLNVQSSGFSPLTTLQLQGGFHALLLGIVSGSVVLLVEIFVACEYVTGLLFRG